MSFELALKRIAYQRNSSVSGAMFSLN